MHTKHYKRVRVRVGIREQRKIKTDEVEVYSEYIYIYIYMYSTFYLNTKYFLVLHAWFMIQKTTDSTV